MTTPKAIGLAFLAAILMGGLVAPDLLSIGLFAFALVGIGEGLHRGFWKPLDTDERRVVSATLVLCLVTALCFALGRQTHPGFRILGRDLRILLLIPAYLAIRRLQPSARQLGVILWLAAMVALFYSLTSLGIHGISHRVKGVTGVPIVFGDLSLLSGILGAWLLMPKTIGRPRWKWILASIPALTSLGSGILAALASGTRGAWIAIPPLVLLGAIALNRRTGAKHPARTVCTVCAVMVLAFVLAMVPGSPVRPRLVRAAHQTWSYLRSNALPMLEGSRPRLGCFNSHHSLDWLRRYIRTAPPLDRGDLSVVSTPGSLPGCPSHMAFRAQVAYSTDWLTILVNTTSRRPGFHDIAVLAKGHAQFQVAPDGPVVDIRSTHFKSYWAYGETGRFSPFIFHLHPGWTLTFVPLTTYPWEFSYDPSGNSIGNRLALWSAALMVFAQHPWLGGGTGSFMSYAEQLERQGRVPPVVWGYQHAHNDFLNQLATEGIIGFSALLFFYAALLLAFRGRPDSRSFDARVFMALFVLGFCIFGLTETLWIHTLVVDWIVFVIASGLALGRQRTSGGPG